MKSLSMLPVWEGGFDSRRADITTNKSDCMAGWDRHVVQSFCFRTPPQQGRPSTVVLKCRKPRAAPEGSISCDKHARLLVLLPLPQGFLQIRGGQQMIRCPLSNHLLISPGKLKSVWAMQMLHSENKPSLVELFLIATIALQRSGASWALAEMLSLL